MVLTTVAYSNKQARGRLDNYYIRLLTAYDKGPLFHCHDRWETSHPVLEGWNIIRQADETARQSYLQSQYSQPYIYISFFLWKLSMFGPKPQDKFHARTQQNFGVSTPWNPRARGCDFNFRPVLFRYSAAAAHLKKKKKKAGTCFAVHNLSHLLATPGSSVERAMLRKM